MSFTIGLMLAFTCNRKHGSYPCASPVLLPERFEISTGEIPLHLRLPIEWDSPELCPYAVSCSPERLIVLLLRQTAL